VKKHLVPQRWLIIATTFW
jgi:hypothetical protein